MVYKNFIEFFEIAKDDIKSFEHEFMVKITICDNCIVDSICDCACQPCKAEMIKRLKGEMN